MDYDAHKVPPAPGESSLPESEVPPPAPRYTSEDLRYNDNSPSPQRMAFLNGREDVQGRYRYAAYDNPHRDYTLSSGVSVDSLAQQVVQSARDDFPPPGVDGHQAHEPAGPEAYAAGASPHRPVLGGQGPTHVETVAEQDALARQAITDALVGLLRNRFTTEPMTIGLFGEWGSGKSSQVSFVKKQLETPSATHPHIRLIEFNAWEHEKCDNLSAALAQTVVEKLIQETSLMEQWKLARQLAARKRAHITKAANKDWLSAQLKIYQWLAPFMSMGPVLALAIASLVLQFDMNWFAKLASMGVLALSAWKAVNKYVTENLTTWFKRIAGGEGGGPFGLPDYAAKLGSFHEIRETLQHLVSLRVEDESDAGKGEYLLIVVDDLDRCNVGTIKLVLDAVRLVTNLPRVITMVAVDDRIAFPAVESFFEQFKGSGRDASAVARDYLAKVFNVSITLPPVPEQLVAEFIKYRLFADTYSGAAREDESRATSQAERSTSGVRGTAADDDTGRVTDEEAQEFTRLALAIGMRNPRALWRMRQAWYLLRRMIPAFDPGSSFEPWMRSLFVREAVLAQPAEVRRQVDSWASWIRKGHTTTAMPTAAPIALAALLRENMLDVAKCWHSVDIVLLPAAAPAAK
jgi:hypothetical protein